MLSIQTVELNTLELLKELSAQPEIQETRFLNKRLRGDGFQEFQGVWFNSLN